MTVMMPAVNSVLRVSGSVKFGSGQLSMTSCGGSKPPGIVVMLIEFFVKREESKYHTTDGEVDLNYILNCIVRLSKRRTNEEKQEL